MCRYKSEGVIRTQVWNAQWKKSDREWPQNVHLQLALFWRKMGLWAAGEHERHCAVCWLLQRKEMETGHIQLVNRKKNSAAVWLLVLHLAVPSALHREEIRARSNHKHPGGATYWCVSIFCWLLWHIQDSGCLFSIYRYMQFGQVIQQLTNLVFRWALNDAVLNISCCVFVSFRKCSF